MISNSFTGSILNNIFISTIRKLKSINIHVKAFIIDQDTNFLNFSKKNYVSPDEPHNEKIVYIFDPPHLLKSTFNMFLKYNFILENKLVDKTCLNFYYKDFFKPNVSTALTQTYSHVHSRPFKKKTIDLTFHIFNKSFIESMINERHKGFLLTTTEYIITFIHYINKLFHIFYSFNIHNNSALNWLLKGQAGSGSCDKSSVHCWRKDGTEASAHHEDICY